MKNNSLATKLLMLAIILGLLTYFGFQVYRYYDDPLTTTLAYSYQVKEGADLSGFVVRSEQVLNDDTNGLLRLQRGEGERVGAGGVVASVYADQASLDRQNEIDTLTTRIEQLRYAQDATLGAEVSLKLDAQIVQNILSYRSSLAADRLYDAEKEGGELRALVLKRDYNHSGTDDLAAQIQTLQEQLNGLKSQAASSVRRITAPVSGLYSAVVDGYETVLTPQTMMELTASKLSEVKEDSSVHSQVGKLILGDAWYYVAAMKTEDAERLKGASGLSLQFSKGDERLLPVTVYHIGESEKGQTVVIFQGREYMAQTTLLRQQSAQVVRTIYDGIRVPKEALRALKTTLDSEGERDTQDVLGLYCLVGQEAKFKPVDVLYNGEGFLLVRPTEDSTDKNRLRPGDQVIITANDLFDGKIVQ